MAITRYAGDRFTIGDGDTKPTGVLDGAVLIDTGNLELYIKRNGAWVEVTGAGNSVVPGTPLNSVQFNNAGAFGGDADLTFTDGNRLNVNKLGISGNIYDSNNSIGNNGMVLTNEGATGVNWKTIEDVLSGVGGSGVANYVARWSDEDTLTSGVLVDNGTNVGINVPSPSYNLEIADSGSPTVRIEDTTNNSRLDLRAEDSSVLIRSTSNFPMRFDVNQTERMRIATDGNVGIGTNIANQKLHINGSTLINNNNHHYGYTSGGAQAVLIGIKSNNHVVVGQDNVNHSATNIFGGTGVIDFSTGGFTRVTIAVDGNVGIGTNAPSQKLHVNGTIKAGIAGDSSANTPALLVAAAGTSPQQSAIAIQQGTNEGDTIIFADYEPYVEYGINTDNGSDTIEFTGGTGTNNLGYKTLYNNAGSARTAYKKHIFSLSNGNFTAGGSVGIGTNNPSAGLHVVNSGEPTAIIESTNAGSSGSRLQLYHNSASPADNDIISNIQITSKDSGGTKRYAALIQTIAADVNASSVDGDVRFLTYKSDTASEVLRITHDKYVGIGTNAPSETLHVNGLTKLGGQGKTEGGAVVNYATFGEIKGGAHTLLGNAVVPGTANNTIQHSKSDAGNYIRLNYTAGIAFHTNITNTVNTDVTYDTNERMRIALDGNVGIGTTSPASKLEVVSAVDANTAIFRSTNNRASVKIQSSATSQSSYLSFINGSSQIAFIDGRYDDDYLRIATTKTEGFLAFETSTQVERVRITPDGNVGIGTTDPKGHLHVHSGSSGATVDVSSDNLIVESSDHGGISLLVPDNKGSVITFGTSGDAIGAKLQWDYANNAFDMATAKAGGFIRFKVADQVEAMRITADGNVGIGDNIVDPEHRFHVSGDAIISGYLYDSTNSTGVDGYVLTSKEDGPQWKQIEDVLSGVGGSGVANYVARWSDEDTITSGTIYDNATKVGIGTSNPLHLLHVKGDVFISGKLYDATNSTGNKGYVLTSDDTGPVWAASGDFDTLSGNLIATGAIIDDISGNLIATGAIVDDISGNLITTGQTLTSNLISTGQTLQTQITSNDSDISTLTSNLITTGQTLTTNINTVATNLGTSGQTLQTQITSNDSDISTLTTNLGTTGQTLQTQITSNDSDISTLSSNLITTGQTLQTQITSNDSDISTLTSNLVTTGQTLTTNINTVSTNLISTGKIVDDISGNLITTGNFLESEIAIVSGLVSGDPEIVGTGTANFIPKFDDENSITDSIIKEVSSNIGISTASPAVKLDVVGLSGAPANTSTTQQGSLRLSQNGGNGVLDMGFYTSANGTAWLQSTNKANLSTNYDLSLQPNGGNVGISNTSPSAKLHIGGTFFDAANDLGTAALGIKQSGTSSENGIYIERSGERKGYYIGIAGVDGLTFRRNNGGTKSDIMSLTREGNVGIGTDSPEFKLQVENTVAAGSDNFILNVRNPTHASDSRAGIAFRMNSDTGSNWDGAGIQATNNGVDGAGHLTFGSVLNNSYTEHVRIQSDGKVGIGTNAPAAKLEARATGSLSAANLDIQDANTSITSGYMVLNLSNSDTTTGNHIRLNFADSVGGSEGSVAMISAKCTNHSSNYGDLQFWTRGSASSGIRMHIDEDGNVGIGTVSPSAGLHVVNGGEPTAIIESTNAGSSGSRLQLYHNSASPADNDIIANLQFKSNDSGGVKRTAALIQAVAANVNASSVDGDIRFSTYNADTQSEVMRITHDGKVGIGITNPSNSAILHVKHADPAIRLEDSSPNGLYGLLDAGGGDFIISADGGAGSANSFISFRVDGTAVGSEKMRITNGGNVGIGTNAPSETLHVNGLTKLGGQGKTEGGAVVNYATFGEIKGGAHTLLGNAVVPGTANNTIQHSKSDAGNYIRLNYTAGIAFHTNITNTVNTDVTYDTNERMRIALDGNVGIGTTDPVQKLEVFGNQRISNSGVLEFFGGTVYPQISRNSTSGGLIIDTAGGGVSNSVPLLSVRENGGTDFVTVLGSGNVGIGTDDPDYKLMVVGTETTTALAVTGAGQFVSNDFGTVFKTTSTTQKRSQLFFKDSSDAITSRVGNDIEGSNSSKLQLIAGSGTTAHMTIISDGNVGIGTNAPSRKLHVNGSVRVDGDIRQYSTAANSVILHDFYDNTGGVLLAKLEIIDNTSASYFGGSLSFGQGVTKYVTLTGNSLIGGKLILETTSSAPSITLNGNGDTIFNESGAAYDFRIEGDTEQNLFFVDGSSDRIGIGTATVDSIFHVYSAATSMVRLQSASGNNDIGLDFYNGTDLKWEIRNNGNDHSFFIIPQSSTDSDAAFVIKSNGNVGIGTSDTSHQLYVNGNCRIDGTQLISDVSVGYDWLQLYEPAGDGGSKIVSIERLAGGARLMLMDDGGSIKNKISSDAAQKTYFNNGSVGIGTASPVYGLDNKSSSIRTNSYTAEKTFGISFPNSTAHQKVDLSFPYFDGGLFWGYLEVTITSTYSNQLSTGKLAKVFSVGLNAPGGSAGSYTSQIYDNKSYYTSAYGAIATQWGIEGINFNSTTGQYYITIAHRVSTGNSIRVSVKAYGYSADYLGSNRFGGLSVGSVYTTDTTVFDDPVIQVPEFHVDANNSNHNLKIGTRGGNMNLFSFTDAGAGAPLAFEGTEFRFISGSVGIGTTSISILSGAKLDVRGNIYSQGYYFSKSGALVGGNITLTNQAGDADSNDFTITASHSTNSVVLRAAQKVEFWTYAGGAYNQRMVILNNGCVGIGTNSASSKLHVYGGELVVNQTTVGDNIIDLQNNGDTAFKIDTSATINYLYLISPPVGSASGVTALYASASKTLGSWMALKDTAGSDSHTISSWAGVVFNETGSSIDFRIEGGTEQNLFFVDGSSDRIGIGTNSPITTLNLVNNDESTTQTNFTQALTNAGILITTEYTAGAYTPGIFWNTSDNNATKPKAGIYLKEASNGSNLYFGTSNSYATGITNDAMVINQNGCVKLGAYGSGTCTGTAAYKLSVDSSGNIIETPIGAGAVDGAGTTNYVTKWTDSDTIGNSLIRDDGTNVGIGTTGNGYKLRVQGDVYISGNLTEASSAAIKENIETYSPSLDIINKLRPVTYNKKKNKKKEIGLIAEELVELFPELVEIDKDGKPTGINYSRAVTVLLGGFKELYKEVQELKKRI